MSFKEALKSGKFLVTMDVIPPKGIDFAETLEKIRPLRTRVDAVNVVDMPSAVMRMSPLPFSALLKREGYDPIFQITCRDRNRLALQGDLLGAAALGIENALILTGDPADLSDDPHAKPVFDLDSVALLRAARGLEQGHDMAGKKLKGCPSFCLGAAVDPGAAALETEIEKMEKKVSAGAEFFQTQPIYDVDAFAGFMKKVSHLGAPVLAGIFLLKSAKMGRFINQNVPGVHIPDNILDEMEKCDDPVARSIQIAVRTIEAVRGFSQGAHIMTINWEEKIPRILDALSLKGD